MATEEQTTYNTANPVGYHSTLQYHRSAQKLTISSRIVSRLGFWLEKVGTPPGNVTFAIYKTSDDSVIVSKLWGAADSLTTSAAFYEVIFDSPIAINEEVRIAVVDTESNNTNYIKAWYSSSNEKADEYFSHYYQGAWTDVSHDDFAYIYTYESTELKVSTQNVSAVSGTIATGHGEIVTFGTDASVTQHGHCWDTSTNPTTALSTKTTNGATSATGTFTSAITGLTPYTTYYVRAYATDTIETVYGGNVPFVSSYGGTSGEDGGQIAIVQERFHYLDAYGVERWIEGTAI